MQCRRALRASELSVRQVNRMNQQGLEGKNQPLGERLGQKTVKPFTPVLPQLQFVSSIEISIHCSFCALSVFHGVHVEISLTNFISGTLNNVHS